MKSHRFHQQVKSVVSILSMSYPHLDELRDGTFTSSKVVKDDLECFSKSMKKLHSHIANRKWRFISRYLDDLLNIENTYFEGVINQIYPPKLQLNKANTSDSEASFLDLHLSISNGFVSSKFYDKRKDWFWYSKFSLSGWRCSASSFLRSVCLSAYKICMKYEVMLMTLILVINV